ncbi:MAG TPA: MlaD family protein [Phycisphaerae bacterium]|nr:MlaD family protein [Phycisphaerae bacterium]HUU23117.1 MlaD family protein [Phycisphaerae bacterium]
MTDKTRNLLVGMTVMAALAGLAAMIVLFQEIPAALQSGYRHHVHFANAGGVTAGTDVLLAGRRIGRVTDVQFTDGDARKGVTMTVLIESDVNVPANVTANIRSRSLAGGIYVDLVPGQGPETAIADPATGEPLVWLPKDHPLTITGTAESGGLIPADVRNQLRQSLGSFERLADALSSFLAPAPPSTASAPTTAGTIAATQPSLGNTLAKLDAALDAVSDTLDAKTRSDLKQAVGDLRAAAGKTAEAMEEARALFGEARSAVALSKTTMTNVSAATTQASSRFDELAGKLIDDADQLGKVLTSLQQSVQRIESGEGTAGKLVNDPRLYEELLAATRRLGETLDTFQDLLEQWKAKGIGIKVK